MNLERPSMASETIKSDIPVYLRFLRNKTTHLIITAIFSGSAVHNYYQAQIHPVTYEQPGDEWGKLEMLDGVGNVGVNREEHDVYLTFTSYGEPYKIRLNGTGVEVKVPMPFNELIVQVSEEGEIIAKTTPYPTKE